MRVNTWFFDKRSFTEYGSSWSECRFPMNDLSYHRSVERPGRSRELLVERSGETDSGSIGFPADQQGYFSISVAEVSPRGISCTSNSSRRHEKLLQHSARRRRAPEISPHRSLCRREISVRAKKSVCDGNNRCPSQLSISTAGAAFPKTLVNST